MLFFLIVTVCNDNDATEMPGTTTLFDVHFGRDPNTGESYLSALVNGILTSEAIQILNDTISIQEHSSTFVVCHLPLNAVFSDRDCMQL